MEIIIGGAGFIGTNLARYLLDKKKQVSVIDDFSLGSYENVKSLGNCAIYEVDATDYECLNAVVQEILTGQVTRDVTVWHLAANSDIQAGVADYSVDLQKTFLTTSTLLSIMEKHSIRKLNFASSSAIYGDQGFRAITENCGDLQPLSAYGAMKLASEALISAAREKFLSDVAIFRFPNVIGLPATHGILFDFQRKLKENPDVLHVLGDGSQQKSYLHVNDLIRAMELISDLQSEERLKVYNIGPTDDGVTVRYIAEQFAKHNGNPRVIYGTEDRGWVGDIPKFRYNVEKLQQLGWLPSLSSSDAVDAVIQEFKK